jgi:hypothetical protein
MKYVLVLLSALAALATANPVLRTVVNEFGFYGDSLGWVELHAEPLPHLPDLTGWVVTTNTSACTLSCTIPPGGFLVLDSASLAGGAYGRGTFRLNLTGDHIHVLPDSLHDWLADGVEFPALPAGWGKSPLPPVGASASVFNREVGQLQTINWYIDSTPTAGWDNDDYSSVAGTVTWAPSRDFIAVKISVSGPMGGSGLYVRASGQSYEAPGLGPGRYAVEARGWGAVDTTVFYPESVDVGYSQMLPGIDIDFDPPDIDFDPPEGVKAIAPSRKPAPTILAGASGVKRLASSVVFDAMGRRVLHPKPGVYFLREAQAQAHAVRKVVITR